MNVHTWEPLAHPLVTVQHHNVEQVLVNESPSLELSFPHCWIGLNQARFCQEFWFVELGLVLSPFRCIGPVVLGEKSERGPLLV